MWTNLAESVEIWRSGDHDIKIDQYLPVGEVEVELPVDRYPESGQTEVGEVGEAEGGLLVGEEGDPLGGAAVEVERLPDRELEDPQQGVPHVVNHLPHPVLPARLEGSL